MSRIDKYKTRTRITALTCLADNIEHYFYFHICKWVDPGLTEINDRSGVVSFIDTFKIVSPALLRNINVV